MQILNFPFPTPPEPAALLAAEQCLVSLSALVPNASATSLKRASESQLELTPLGRAMAAFPLSPRHSRMLLEAATLVATDSAPDDVLPYSLALAAALSAEAPFVHSDSLLQQSSDNPPSKQALDAAALKRQRVALDNANNTLRNKARSAHHRLRTPHSDAISALNALIAFEAQPVGKRPEFCRDNFLHVANLNEMSALRVQLVRILRTKMSLEGGAVSGHAGAAFLLRRSQAEGVTGGPIRLDASLQPPGVAVSTVLRRCLVAGWADQVARRMRSAEYVSQSNAEKGPRAVRYQVRLPTNKY